MADQSEIDKIVMEGISSFQRNNGKTEGSEGNGAMDNKTGDLTSDGPKDDVPELAENEMKDTGEVPTYTDRGSEETEKSAGGTAYESIFNQDISSVDTETLQRNLGDLMEIAFGM